MRAILACVLAWLFTALSTFAATPDNPAFRRAVVEQSWNWRDGLVIALIADEAQCKKHYGQRWREKCAAPLGQPGTAARGFTIQPAVPGSWEWLDANRAQFTPEKPDGIRPAKMYKINLAQVHRPRSIKIDRDELAVTTLPTGAQLLGTNFWIDPSQLAQHKLTASFTFNYPIPEGSLKPVLAIPADVESGKPELVWNGARDHLAVSWPIIKLGKEPGEALITLHGPGQIEQTDSGLRFTPANPEIRGVRFRQNLPGAANLFAIKEMVLEPYVDDGLNRSAALNIETSLYATSRDLLANLQLWELPKYNGSEALAPYDWQAAPAISAGILKKAKKLTPQPLQNEDSRQASFKYKLATRDGAYILARIDPKFPAASGHTLSKPHFAILRAPDSRPTVGFLQPGNVLPASGSGIIDIFGSDLDKIVWEASKVENPFLALLAQASSNSFSLNQDNIPLDMDALVQNATGQFTLADNTPGKAQFFALPLKEILAKLSGAQTGSGLCGLKLTGYKNGEAAAWATRLILATDLGLIVKASPDDSLSCFVSSISSRKPVPNAKVRVLGKNGLPVAEAATDSSGHAILPSLKGLKRENTPTAIIAETPGSLAWLSLTDAARELNYSDFPTGGSRLSKDGISLHAFSQRGVYRPGDTLKFGCLGRDQNFALLPPSLPLLAEILDPAGRKVWSGSFQSGDFGLALLEWQSSPLAATGKYTLNIRLLKDGDILASCVARIEEFIPETLKIKLDAPAPAGWLLANTQNPPQITAALQNLYGTPARGHNLKTRVETSPAILKFPGFEQYQFTDSAPFSGGGSERELPELKTDDDGKVSMALPGELFGRASALVAVTAEGFTAGGGRAVAARKTFLVSPMEKVLGWRPLGKATNLSFLPINEEAAIELIALDPDLQKREWPDVRLSVSARQYVSSLVSDGKGGYRYDDVPVDQPFKSWTHDVAAKGSKVILPTAAPGEYLLVAKDASGAIIGQVAYTVVGNRLLSAQTAPGNSKIRLKLDKSDYKPGEKINLALSLPYSGHGLITLERAGVQAFKWFESEAGDTVQEIEIPADFEGKGYLTVSFVRGQNSPDIYMAPLAWSVAPFVANVANRDMGLRLSAPEKASPGASLPVSISAKEKGQAIVFAVDEGILQLDNYKTPAPLKTLLEDRALDTRTLQALDLLMPDHGQISARLSAFGGGMDGGIFGKRFQNPFKRKDEPPVVFWSSLISVDSGQTSVQIPVPDYYTGGIRVMAVGSGSTSLGSAEQMVKIDAPLILKPQFPLAVAPGDEFGGSLTLENTTGKDARLALEMLPQAQFELLEPLKGALTLKANSELTLPIRLKAKDTPGSATLAFAANGDLQGRRVCSIAIRPASALRTTIISGAADAPVAIIPGRNLYDEGASVKVLASATPLPLSSGFARFLDTYPYGCTEQLVSKSFALLLTRTLPAGITEADGRKLHAAVFSALAERFNGSGVSLWPNGSPDLLLTAYAADLLMTMKEKGQAVPEGLLANLCQALEYNSSLNDSTIDSARASAYAIWVLTRSGVITTQHLEGLERALNERGMEWNQDITAVLIAASRRHMLMKTPLPAGIDYDPSGWFDEYAQQALHTALVARYGEAPLSERMKEDFFEATALALNERRYATFSAAQGIRALLACEAVAAALPGVRLQCEDPAEAGSLDLENGVLAWSAPKCAKMRLDMPADSQRVYWQAAVTGYDRTLPASRETGIHLEKAYLGPDGLPVEKVRQGDEVTVAITAKSTSGPVADCVLLDILPGGLEMLFNGNVSGNQAKHQEKREDRMIIFTDLDSEPKKFSWKTRAVSPGIFQIPAASAEAMYDQSISGNSNSGRLKIHESR